jgi:hypothetical protein
MAFIFSIPAELLGFSTIAANPQSNMIKTFTVSVDKSLIIAKNFKVYTFSLNVTDDHPEEPMSAVFDF